MIAPPDGARRLCGRNVDAGPGRVKLAWSTYAVTDEVQAVVAHYQRTLGVTLVLHSDPVAHFALPHAEGERGDERLSIYAAHHHGKFPSCNVVPRAGELTVVLIALATRPA